MLFKRYKIKRLTKKIKALQLNRIHTQPKEEIIAKEILYYHSLIKIYEKLLGHKKYPFAQEMIIACLRRASTLDDTDAQYAIARKLLEEAKFRERLQLEGVFSSNSNERQMKQLYEEAHAYLQAAEKLNHVLAKRLRGLCYINGWGVTVDKNQGFEMVVASIEQENSWDKIPQIFAAIGLNKPEFFTAIMQRRKT